MTGEPEEREGLIPGYLGGDPVPEPEEHPDPQEREPEQGAGDDDDDAPGPASPDDEPDESAADDEPDEERQVSPALPPAPEEDDELRSRVSRGSD